MELEKIKEAHKNELEKIQLEMEAQARLYEQNKQTDVVSNAMDSVMGEFLKNPVVQRRIEQELDKAFK